MTERKKLMIDGIPAILWGKPSRKIYIHVHGKMSRKEYAERFAEIAEEKGWQTLSFDLPEHGERTDTVHRCDVWNGIHDLNAIADYAFANWDNCALFACSLGAYFSLNAYGDRPFERCLFQSPILDMEWLVRHMMIWSNVTEKQLEEKSEISTDIDTLRWDYYRYILSHPITRWDLPTAILYGGRDNLQPIEAIRNFAEKFGARLTVSEQSEHPFMSAEELEIADKWLVENI